jgi:hypothetical protein
MDPYVLDGRQTVIIAILAMYLGKFVNSKVDTSRTRLPAVSWHRSCLV